MRVSTLLGWFLCTIISFQMAAQVQAGHGAPPEHREDERNAARTNCDLEVRGVFYMCGVCINLRLQVRAGHLEFGGIFLAAQPSAEHGLHGGPSY